MEDKLRIANKVNTKYKELMNEMDENIKQAMEEIGTDEATTEALIAEHQQSQAAVALAASAVVASESRAKASAATAVSGTTLSTAPVTVNTVTTTVRCKKTYGTCIYISPHHSIHYNYVLPTTWSYTKMNPPKKISAIFAVWMRQYKSAQPAWV